MPQHLLICYTGRPDRERWEIEVNYDRLKNKMELENYSGKLENTISQDFYSSIYIFNLAMILRNKYP